MKELQPRVVYLHGFNSSPASLKARLFSDYCSQHRITAVVPTLSYDPGLAMNAAEACVQLHKPCLLVGSSLGGYYATFLAEKHGIKAALINPAVSPCDNLHEEFLGKQRNYHSGEEYEFTRNHVEVLRSFDVKQISDPTRYLLLVQTGDEVLNYRLAVDRYRGCQQVVQTGGSHAFENFSEVLPVIMRFAGLQ